MLGADLGWGGGGRKESKVPFFIVKLVPWTTLTPPGEVEVALSALS